MEIELKDEILMLSNDTAFLLKALSLIIESKEIIEDSTFCGLLNYVRDVNDRHDALLDNLKKTN